ncbi:MAG: 4Fe-4S dicluster domain-containing protein [Thermodesulfovibrio sp.]|nr:4Fe-4S dicluster domain-containing protein [Thermodesulfovibrio sp.]
MEEVTVNVIDLNQCDEDFIKQLIELGAEELKECIQCGKCASTCPMALAGLEFFIKRIIHAATLGLRDILIEDPSVWACQSCNRCVEICPMDVKPYEIIQAVRRAAVRVEACPASTYEGLRNLYRFGHAVFPKGFEERRKKAGLPEKPPTALSFDELRKKYQEVLKQTILEEIAPFPLD